MNFKSFRIFVCWSNLPAKTWVVSSTITANHWRESTNTWTMFQSSHLLLKRNLTITTFGGVKKIMSSAKSPAPSGAFELSTRWPKKPFRWTFAKKILSIRSSKNTQNSSTATPTTMFGARSAQVTPNPAISSWTKPSRKTTFPLKSTRSLDFHQQSGCSSFWTKIKNSPLCWFSAIFTFSMSVCLRFCSSKKQSNYHFSPLWSDSDRK